jgi:hypothetical protein
MKATRSHKPDYGDDRIMENDEDIVHAGIVSKSQKIQEFRPILEFATDNRVMFYVVPRGQQTAGQIFTVTPYFVMVRLSDNFSISEGIVLEEEFLIDQTGHILQQPARVLFHRRLGKTP